MKKERIVLLPGYDGNGDKTFTKLIRLIDKKYNVVTIDYPYLTDKLRQYSLDEIMELINKRIKNKVTILGFSMGGFVASSYAQKYPINIKKIILVSSSTHPILDKNLSKILATAKLLLSNKLTSYILTKLFLMTNLKNFPLPKPGKNFRPEYGYTVFGSLARVMTESRTGLIKADKLAILFDDDRSFPAKIYNPVLKKQNFKVVTFKTGGHAEGVDYWEKVANSL